MRAGVVEFLGPEPVFGVDRQAGCFIADAASVAGARYSAEHMIEAMMPPNRITQATSPLVDSLLSDGLAQPASFDTGSEVHVHKGFAVTEQPYRLLTVQGQPVDAVYVLGFNCPPSSGAQLSPPRQEARRAAVRRPLPMLMRRPAISCADSVGSRRGGLTSTAVGGREVAGAALCTTYLPIVQLVWYSSCSR